MIKTIKLNVEKHIKGVPKVVVITLSLFIFTRLALTIIGIYSKETQLAFNVKPLNLPEWQLSNSKTANIWSRWDTNIYLDVSLRGYSIEENEWGMANYAFFPAYPMLVRLMATLTNTKTYSYYDALIISNLAFIGSSILLYKLAKKDSDEKEALRAVKYLYLLPVSFLFSSALTESLFLFLLLLTFYFAREKKWALGGIAGFFLALTRPVGVLVFIPLVAEYLDTMDGKINILAKLARLAWTLLVPIGFLLFAYFVYNLTGNSLSLVTAQNAWGRFFFVNPIFLFAKILLFLDYSNYFSAFVSSYSFVILALLISNFNKIRPSYWILGMLLMLVPMSTGLQSILRLTLPIFPIYLILARVSKREWLDQTLTITLALIQGALMIAWVAGSYLPV
jgi:hypothetical protein